MREKERHSKSGNKTRGKSGWSVYGSHIIYSYKFFCKFKKLYQNKEFVCNVCSESELKVLVIQYCLTLCDCMDCSLRFLCLWDFSKQEYLEWSCYSLLQRSSDPEVKANSPSLPADYHLSLPEKPI